MRDVLRLIVATAVLLFSLGASAGVPYQVADVNPGKSGSTPANLTAASGLLYFVATDPAGLALYRTDGTASGTLALTRLSAPDLFRAGAVGNDIFFQRAGDIWKSDGTPGGTMLADNFGGGRNRYLPAGFTSAGGRVFIVMPDDDGSGYNLWSLESFDGAAVPLERKPARFPDLTTLAPFRGGWFWASSLTNVLFTSDGTRAGTHLFMHVPSISNVPEAAVGVAGGYAYFTAALGQIQLWKTNGRPEETVPVANLESWSYGSAAVGSTLYFVTSDASHGMELWKTNATANGTQLVKDINPGPGSSTIGDLVSVGDHLLFTATDSVHQTQLWISDGTSDGTRMLTQNLTITPAPSPDVQRITVADGIAYFPAADADHGMELWQTDGTPDGTKLVADIEPGKGGSNPSDLTHVGSRIFFQASTTASGSELWAMPTSGTPAITIEDVAVSEPDRVANVRVSLTQSAITPVSVSYETIQGNAISPGDFGAQSGTITFDQGQTEKTISIPIADDTVPETNKSFSVHLKDGSVAIERSFATVFVNDDDISADLAVSFAQINSFPTVIVHNNGPMWATEINVCYATRSDNSTCLAVFELAPGASSSIDLPPIRDRIVATASAWEHDPDPENNSVTAAVAGYSGLGLYVIPFSPRVGDPTSLIVASSGFSTAREVSLKSSDPAVLPVPPTVTIPANSETAQVIVTPIKSGTVTLTVTNAAGSQSLTIEVGGPHRRSAHH